MPRVAIRAMVLGLFLSGAAGAPCVKCQEEGSGDWTIWDCAYKTGEVCLNLLGDWTTWESCCGLTTAPAAAAPTAAPTYWPMPAPEAESTWPPAPAPPAVRTRSFQTVQSNCDCSWTHGPFGCGSYDGTECWNACCSKPACDCTWARVGGCGQPDGTLCWDVCCIKSTPECNCAWVNNGGCFPASKNDGSKCWDQCCHAYAGTMTFFGQVAQQLFAAKPVTAAWLGALLGLAGILGIVAAARRSSMMSGGFVRSFSRKEADTRLGNGAALSAPEESLHVSRKTSSTLEDALCSGLPLTQACPLE